LAGTAPFLAGNRLIKRPPGASEKHPVSRRDAGRYPAFLPRARAGQETHCVSPPDAERLRVPSLRARRRPAPAWGGRERLPRGLWSPGRDTAGAAWPGRWPWPRNRRIQEDSPVRRRWRRRPAGLSTATGGRFIGFVARKAKGRWAWGAGRETERKAICPRLPKGRLVPGRFVAGQGCRVPARPVQSGVTRRFRPASSRSQGGCVLAPPTSRPIARRFRRARRRTPLPCSDRSREAHRPATVLPSAGAWRPPARALALVGPRRSDLAGPVRVERGRRGELHFPARGAAAFPSGPVVRRGRPTMSDGVQCGVHIGCARPYRWTLPPAQGATGADGSRV
jgi:hypothetical protein